jgi:type IV secretory pathway TrbD component
MDCPYCGTQIVPGYSRCSSCRSYLSPRVTLLGALIGMVAFGALIWVIALHIVALWRFSVEMIATFFTTDNSAGWPFNYLMFRHEMSAPEILSIIIFPITLIICIILATYIIESIIKKIPFLNKRIWVMSP